MRQGIASGLALAFLAAGPQAELQAGAGMPKQPMAQVFADADNQWAVSLMLNVIFAAEYLAVAEIAAMDPQSLQNFKEDPKAKLLAERARFVLAAARARGQELGLSEAITRTLVAHGIADHAPPPGAEAVELSLSAATQQQYWKVLQVAFRGDKLQCPLATSEVVAFADLQKRALSNQQPLSSAQLLGYVENWSPEKIRCLIFALMGSSEEAKRDSGFDPMPLLQALRQKAHGVLEGPALKALTIARLVQLSDYAESLRLLIELTDSEPAFRLPYEIVQRVFGIRQRGGGAVALRGP